MTDVFFLQAPLSPVASKASSGALERMDVRSVGVMPRFLSKVRGGRVGRVRDG